MQPYLDLVQKILDYGVKKEDRTGVGTLSLFGHQMRWDLRDGFPLTTTKRLHIKSIVYELIWFLKGDSNIRYLKDNGVSIWDEWADESGNLGPIYGVQWRAWKTADGRVIDQISNVIDQIHKNPNSRRLIVSAWNVGEIESMALPPCHVLFQFYIANNRLSCQLYQRSADVFIGVPFNIASYSLLTFLVAQVCNLEPGEFIHTFGDVHLYLNHIPQAKVQLSRKPFPLPKVEINPDIRSIFDFKYEDLNLIDYQSHPSIKAEIAV